MVTDPTPLLHKAPIAIVGMGCRFPGAEGPGAFWDLLCRGEQAVSEVPPNRFDIEALYHPTPATPGRTSTRLGGFLEDVDRFDASFFGISPREAAYMDPQQRLLLEVAWEALEDGGHVLRPVRGSEAQAGVFIGMWLNEYEARMFEDMERLDFYMTTGSGRYAASGRLSYALGLGGPSVTVDTACSSSLVAVHLACQSLRAGECEFALAGAANVILQPYITVAYSQSKMMAPDGRCKFGDAAADGYVRSEGAAVVVLKRLSDALENGDDIYAVIRGSAVNNDGQGNGYLATPSQAGQEDLLRKAYQDAGVRPQDVQYVEAHGTGTRAGDPIEVGAIGAVLGEGRPAGKPLRAGSVKTNIGHTEGAAGLAGLIKTALAMRHRELPASLHQHRPNPNIPWEQLHVEVQKDHSAWPEEEKPFIAGVSAFGITGTNGHVVLEEAPPTAPGREEQSAAGMRLLTLSARSASALEAVARSYEQWMEGDEGNLPTLYDLCYTAAVRRTHHEHRLALVADSPTAIKTALEAFVAGVPSAGTTSGRASSEEPDTVFVFPGQGSQWLGMGRQLYAQEPAFRAMIDRCEQAFAAYVDWSLVDELQAAPDASQLEEIDVIQPTLFAIQVALAAVWRSWGIEPVAVVGHSMGEVAAAYVAGVLSLEDAARVICWRSKLMKRVSGRGAMAVVELSLNEAEETLSGYEGRLSIAVNNGPRSVVLAGDADALDEVLDALERLEVFCRRVKVDVASHSPHMEPLAPHLVEVLLGLQPREEEVPIYSTVTASLQEGIAFDAAYWGRNLRQPVRFAETVQHLAERGPHLFIEVSPHPLLQQAILSTLQHVGDSSDDFLALPSLRREEDERASLLGSLGALYVHGVMPAWEGVYPEGGSPVKLPPYPWQRERFWYTDVVDGRSRRRATSSTSGHPLLGNGLKSGVHHETYLWPIDLEAASDAFGSERLVGQVTLMPEAALVEAGLAAAKDALGLETAALEEVRFEEPLPLASPELREAQLALSASGVGAWTFRVVSRERVGGAAPWISHVTGTLHAQEAADRRAVMPEGLADDATVVSAESHYVALAEAGVAYTEGWRGIEELRLGERAASAEVRVPEALRGDMYRLHPVVLDACFQLLGRLAPAGAYAPHALRTLRLHHPLPPEAALTASARVTSEDDGEGVEGEVLLMDEAGTVCVEIEGVHLRRLENLQGAEAERLLYEVVWQAQPLAPDVARAVPGRWVVFADRGGIGEAVAALLEARGATCSLVYAGSEEGALHRIDPVRPEDYVRVLKALGQEAPLEIEGVLYLWGLDAPDAEEDVGSAAIDEATSVLYLAQALVQVEAEPRLWLVTRGVHHVASDDHSVSVVQAPIWGMGLGIAYDHPEFRCACLDLSAADADESRALADELVADGPEDRVALRGTQRWVARLLPHTASSSEQETLHVDARSAGAEPYVLGQLQPGVLDTLGFRSTSREEPGPGEIEIEVDVAGLNFIDVLKALNAYPGQDQKATPALGAECAGRITAVGSDVHGLQPGDEVVALSSDLDRVSCFSRYITVPAELAVRKPSRLSMQETAALPTVFLTAYYALHHLGRLEKGERVLIHSAAGGVGLAAVQLAQRVGAEIFATAGTEEKRAYLRGLGIPHVMDSRSLAFADEVMERTGGRGVDVVLNSLTGEALRASLAVLAPYGRFLEIGKRDLYENSQVGLAPFQRSLSFFSIDLARLIVERRTFVAGMLRELVEMLEEGELEPLPTRGFGGADVADAFRYMARAEHIGKIVVQMRGTDVSIVQARPSGEIRADATYLITGGLGGIGLLLARWLAERGARYLCLIGRRGPSEEARRTLDALRQQGVEVRVESADVTKRDDVARVLADIEQEMPPLRGVFHAAGGLDDGVVANLSAEQLSRVMAPKAEGVWNLHVLTQKTSLDHFVLFSSVASVVGLPGQSNYVAANAFLDAMARHRVAVGQPACSINWGPWAEIGLAAAREDRGERLAAQGIGSLLPEEGCRLMGHALGRPVSELAAVRFYPAKWKRVHPAAAVPFFESLQDVERIGEENAHSTAGVLELLRHAETKRQRESLLRDHVRAEVGQVLRLGPDRIDVEAPFKNMGLDSLMTIELRNRLQASLQLKLSATLVWNYPNIVTMSRYLVDQLQLESEKVTGSAISTSVSSPSGNEVNVDDLAEMSDDEAQAMLEEKLALLDDRMQF